MRAIAHHQFGNATVLRPGTLPVPHCTPDSVQIRVFAAALNPIDIEVRNGHFRLFSGRRFPRIPACDFAGEIVATGSRVRDFQVGQRVFGMRPTLRGGALGEYLCMKTTGIGLIPESLSWEEAAGLPLAALTALQSLRDLVGVQAGARVLINGASGGVGVFAIQIARAMGATVVGVCSHRNLGLVTKLGADEVIDYTQTDLRQTDRQFDVIFDVYGNQSFPRIRHLLVPGGRHVTTIPSPRNFRYALMSRFQREHARVVMVRSLTADLDQLSAWIRTGDLRPVIDRVYEITAATEAFEYLETRRARGKVVLRGFPL